MNKQEVDKIPAHKTLALLMEWKDKFISNNYQYLYESEKTRANRLERENKDLRFIIKQVEK